MVFPSSAEPVLCLVARGVWLIAIGESLVRRNLRYALLWALQSPWLEQGWAGREMRGGSAAYKMLWGLSTRVSRGNGKLERDGVD